MRRIRGIAVAVAVVAVVLGVGVSSAGSASAPTNRCTAEPGKVTLAPDGRVRAGRVSVVCRGAWVLHQSVMWAATGGDWVSGKWSYGGSRDYHGTGSMTVPAFDRPYHHCAWWRLEVTLKGVEFKGPITKFCS